ncbi:Uncharacterised protein [uncultured Clostridium sp.]|uniref:hypothetical protein n=1 Tax=uncultured Clostridium sp. TaxID=59620 RepID=UPI000822C726|nr:hypothetical protein [uncultured Clostridium sp.]SCJ52353.1 Uncharacterised protein [uncultured Clostridium sp.]
MKPIETNTSNCILTGGEGVADLPVTRGMFNGSPVVESCWKLSHEEIEEVKRTGLVYFVCEGHTHPPILLATESIVEVE